jgi:hypothetical protein
MPKVPNAGMSDAHSAITAFLGYMNIQFSTDYTCDANGNITGLYVYGTISQNSFAYMAYGRLYWYVVTTSNSQTFACCNYIYFYDDYDPNGNFLGRKINISGITTLFSYSLPRDIIYSYDAGGLALYIDRIIINDNGSIFSIPVVFAGIGYYDGSSTLVTQKLRWLICGDTIDINAYWGSLNNYEVVQIDNSYYFKIPNYNALLPGDGTEGTVKTPNVTIVSEDTASALYLSGSEIWEEDTASALYLSGSEIWEEGFILSMPKLFKVNIELV